MKDLNNAKKAFHKKNKVFLFLYILLTCIRDVTGVFLMVWIVNRILGMVMAGGKINIKYQVLFIVFLLSAAISRFMSEFVKEILRKKLIILVEEDILEELSKGIWINQKNKVFSILQNTLVKFSEKYITFLAEKFRIMLMAVLVTAYTFTISPHAVLICLAIVGIGITVMSRGNIMLQAANRNSEEAFNRTYGELMEYVRCMRILPYVNELAYEKLEEKIKENENAQFKVSKLMNMARSSERLSNMVIVLLVAIIFGGRVIQGLFDVASLFSLLLLLPSLSDILFKIPVLMVNNKEIKGLSEVLDKMYWVERQQDTGDAEEEFIATLVVKDLKIYYGEMVSSQIVSFGVKKGDIVGICGKSGCGKSTFVKTLSGLINNYEGSILVNKNEIRDVKKRILWERILFLGQDPILLPLGIGMNVSMTDYDSVQAEQLIDAIEKAELTEYVQKHGMDKVADLESMSSGEKQKLCLGRCFYHSRDVYILDEATNALSIQAEERIMGRLIRKVKEENSILIVISHNPNIMQKCDIIYDFDLEVQL